MEKQKANKFPLVKLFTVDGASCYLYDGRANMFLSLSETEKNLVCEYMASYGTSEGEPCPASFPSGAAAFIARLNGNGILLPGPLEARTPSGMRGEEQLWQQWEEEAIPKKLTLEMTNTCNLRCRYCPYTINEQRGQGKMHASHHLKEEDARKAISDYFHEYTRIFRKVEPEHRTLFLKRNPPAVSFYGGEALLRFSLLEPLVKYVLSLPWKEHHIPAEKVVFHITTNATLLTREMVEFFIRYHFTLAISFDGPPEENDKYRVFKNGQGTGTVVERALDMIREVSEEYLLNHVHIQAVLAPEYDHDKVGRYFEGRSLNGCYGGVRQFSYLEFSDYSESKKTDKQLAQFNIRERIKELYEKGLSPEERYQYILRDPLISAWLRYVYAILTKVGDAPSHKARYFNSCYIGRINLLLDTYGNLHLCERSDFSMPVGEVNSGINRTAVRQMYRDFFEKTDSPSCRSCWAGRFCTLCTAALIKNGAVQEPDRSICRSLRHAQEKQIEDLLYIKEYYPEILEQMERMYFQANDITLGAFHAYVKEQQDVAP